MNKRLRRLAVWLMLTAVCCSAGALDLQGQRGARGLAPENTLRGFALALRIGVTTLELDIAITQDDVVVISHDPVLNPDLTRAPDGRILEAPGPPIRALTFDELQRYDVGRLKPGSSHASRYLQRQPVAPEAIARAVIAAIREAGKPEGSAWTAGIQHRDHGSVPQMAHAAGGRIWSVFYGDLDAAKIRDALALGLQAIAWTVNAQRDIACVIDWGVDGIVSDRPDVVGEELQRRSMARPLATPMAP